MTQIFLNNNELTSLDLSPYQESRPSLNELAIGDNQITNLDLSPLEHQRNLKWLNLYENPLSSIVGLIDFHLYFESGIEHYEDEQLKGISKTVKVDPTINQSHWFLHPDFNTPEIVNLFSALEAANPDRLRLVVHQPRSVVDASRTALAMARLAGTITGFGTIVSKLISADPKRLLVSSEPSSSLRTKLKAKAGVISYLVLGLGLLAIALIFGNFLNLETQLISHPALQLVFLALLGVYIFQGLMIQSYIESNLLKLETGVELLSNKFKLPIKWLIPFIDRLRVHFGVVVGFIWLLTLTSILSESVSTTNQNMLNPDQLANWDFLIPLLTLWNSLKLDLTLPNLILPEFNLLTSFIFTEFIGLAIRVLGILLMFYAVFQKGWGVLLHPGRAKDRVHGEALLDWHEVMALPIGLFLVVLSIGYDFTILSTFPVDAFKLGLLLGGLGYALLVPHHGRWFIQTVVLVTLGYFSILMLVFLGDQVLIQQQGFEVFGLILILFFVFEFIYWGLWPLQKDLNFDRFRNLNQRSILGLILTSNPDYQQTWKRGQRSRLHQWFFADNTTLTLALSTKNMSTSRRRGKNSKQETELTFSIKGKFYPATIITLLLLFVVIPVFSILFLTVFGLQFL